jgi:uncharacterized protein
MSRTRPRFHLAIPVDDLSLAAVFYGGVLGCQRGRSTAEWADWDLCGHQLVTHLVDGHNSFTESVVDGKNVPVPHFGVITTIEEFHDFANRFRQHGVDFAVEPAVRFPGEISEQWTMFLFDPAGNALEFKAFAIDSSVFANNSDES